MTQNTKNWPMNDGDCMFTVTDGLFRFVPRIDDKVTLNAFATSLYNADKKLHFSQVMDKIYGEQLGREKAVFFVDELVRLMKESGVTLTQSYMSHLFFYLGNFLKFRNEIMGLSSPPDIVFTLPPKNADGTDAKMEAVSLETITEKLFIA